MIFPSHSKKARIPVNKFKFTMSKQMPNKTKLIKNFRSRLKEEFTSFASLEYQSHAWLDNDPSVFWPWTEVVCIYFDDLNMLDREGDVNSGLKHYVRQGILTKEEASLIRQFNDFLNKFIDKTTEPSTTEEYEKILADPEWIKITKLAAKILKKIDFDKLPLIA